MIFDKITAPETQQTFDAGFQSQTQTNPINSNPKISNTGPTESIPPTEVSEISNPTSSFLKPGFILPLLAEQNNWKQL